MNRQKQKEHREIGIFAGFMLEVLLFFFAGMVALISYLSAIILLAFAFMTAYLVGKSIKFNVLEAFKWGLND